MHWSNLKSFGRGAKLLAAAIVYLWSFSAHAADPVYCASDADISSDDPGASRHIPRDVWAV